MNRTTRTITAFALALLVAASPAFAAKVVRCSSRTSVTRSATVHRSASVTRGSVTRSASVTRSVGNVHIDRDIDVDVHHGYHNDHHPVAAAIVATAVIGAILYTPPPAYTVVVVDGITYYQCGTTWYQPRFSGTTTTYVVVVAPR
jgi:hypothetical protein